MRYPFERAASPSDMWRVSVTLSARYSTVKMQSRQGVRPVKKLALVGEQMGDPA